LVGTRQLMCLTPSGVNSAFMVYTDLKKTCESKGSGETHPSSQSGRGLVNWPPKPAWSTFRCFKPPGHAWKKS